MNGLDSTGKITRMHALRQFLLIFLPFLVVFTIASLAHYLTVHNVERVARETGETLNVGLARSAVVNDLAAVITDLMFLVDYVEGQGMSPEGDVQLARIGKLFRGFAGQKHLYGQIRLLDVTGQEIVRVNYSRGNPVLVDASELQDKSERYYYREASRLGPHELYISPLDLNIEHGRIEQPFKSVMRFAVPIFDQAGERQAVLVLNYIGDRLLTHFKRAGVNVSGAIHLLDQHGFWLSDRDDQLSWGFMLPHGRRFADRDPVAWSRIGSEVAGQFRSGEHLYTFETVTPSSVAIQAMDHTRPIVAGESGQYRMKVVASVKELRGLDSVLGFFMQHLPLYSVTLLVMLAGSTLATKFNLQHRRSELQGAYERRFRHTLENIQLAAVLINTDGRLEFCNDYFLRLCGWSREEIVGKDWISRFVTPESAEELREILRKLREDGVFPSEFEAELVTREGDHRLIAWHNTPMQGIDGSIEGITGLGEDVTERRRAEEQVRKLSLAVEQSPSIVMLTDRRGCIEYVNPKFVEVAGYEREEVIGKNPRLLKSGETTSEEYRQLWQTVTAGGEWRGEFHNRRKNGELYWEAALISGLRGADGRITHYVAVKEDITERKRLEAEVEERNRELAHSQSLATVGRMASMIAHDLRNPLSSVKMGMQIMAKDSSDQNRELSAIALEQIRHMENILTDMLTYARPEAGKMEWVNIVKLLELSVRAEQRRIDESAISLHTSYQQGLPTVPGEPDKLRQVFSNLLVNAIQAVSDQSAERREIQITAELSLGGKGTAIQVKICDRGEGLSEVDRGKLFEPFYTTRAKGTGLGLAICQQIVEQHGGRVKLEARQGSGACATVILPTVPDSVP